MAARAERLRITLCDLLKIVSIALEADDNAQVIFETVKHGPRFFPRMVPLDAGTVLPIVLLLFRSPQITLERRALRILECWLARRALTRLTAKNYNRLVLRLVAKTNADLPDADDALLTALSAGEGEISRWRTDDELRDFLLRRNVYGWVSQPRLIMALCGVETGLYTNMGCPRFGGHSGACLLSLF